MPETPKTRALQEYQGIQVLSCSLPDKQLVARGPGDLGIAKWGPLVRIQSLRFGKGKGSGNSEPFCFLPQFWLFSTHRTAFALSSACSDRPLILSNRTNHEKKRYFAQFVMLHPSVFGPICMKAALQSTFFRENEKCTGPIQQKPAFQSVFRANAKSGSDDFA